MPLQISWTPVQTLVFSVLLSPALWTRHSLLPSSLLMGPRKPALMSLQGAACTVFHVSDEDTGTSYRINSGAEVSILPCTTNAPALHVCSTSSASHSLYTMDESPLPPADLSTRSSTLAGTPHMTIPSCPCHGASHRSQLSLQALVTGGCLQTQATPTQPLLLSGVLHC